MLSRCTRRLLKHDILRCYVRVLSKFKYVPTLKHRKLHFGCGRRRVEGWLNVDLLDSDWNVDLCAKLPWADGVFDAVVGQQVIEHLDIEEALNGLLSELSRVMVPGGTLWLSCPDIKKICLAYSTDKGCSILESRIKRYPPAWLGRLPSQQIFNELFNQGGEHKNLFDFEFLSFLLQRAGFRDCTEESESIFLLENQGFHPRFDDDVALYVKCVKKAYGCDKT